MSKFAWDFAEADGLHYPDHMSDEEVAEAFIKTGDWGESYETCWVEVYIVEHEPGTEFNAHSEQSNLRSICVTLEPTEPKCASHEDGISVDHDWQTPHELVGGCDNNPGVIGKGGGVECTEVCSGCGIYRVTSNWHQAGEPFGDRIFDDYTCYFGPTAESWAYFNLEGDEVDPNYTFCPRDGEQEAY